MIFHRNEFSWPVEAMEEPPKETVIIVHGTWAAPEPGKARWYQPVDDVPAAEGFVSKLDAALQKRGSPARCWAHCTKGNPIFQWSGENSWIARTRAASALGDYVAKLRNEGWRCHIVAHSHGGNVVVEALPQIMADHVPDKQHGRFVTLGTPFVDTVSPISKSTKRRGQIVKAITWIAFLTGLLGLIYGVIMVKNDPGMIMAATVGILLLIAIFFSGEKGHRNQAAISTNASATTFKQKERLHRILNAAGRIAFVLAALLIIFSGAFIIYVGVVDWDHFNVPTDVGVPFLIAFFFLVVVFFARRKAQSGGDSSTTATGLSQSSPCLLVISSLVDEAWQVLHHLTAVGNPLAIKSSLLSYVFSSLQSNIAQSANVARIHGAKSYSDLGTAAKLVAVIMDLYSPVVFISLISNVYFVWLYPNYYFVTRGIYENMSSVMFFFLTLGTAPAVFVFMWALAMLYLTRLFGEEFLSAFMSPYRWFAQRAGSLIDIGPAVGTYFVRRRGWSVLRKMVTGLEGYRLAMPPIEQFPRSVPETIVKYESMPKGAEERALEQRDAWITRHLGDVSQTFAKLAVTAADLTALLRKVEEDQTLVHAAYYTDDECIARIADWIAGKESASEGKADNNQPPLTKPALAA